MGQALYRKYRSKSLAEIVGQEHITSALTTAISSDRVSHAYLFTGPRGVGKTSIARILAYEINKLPYDSEATHLDIIEIDAASNRRIDEVRDLRDKIHLAPAAAKFKVYIIDEVHMLTREAFNALLKTLEEPPKHIVFILATTEVHKLPETIISRTQHFTFKPIEIAKVVEHLASIAKQEKITIDTDALKLIAEHGGGSFRDSISILDQARSTNSKITVTDVEQLLGIAPAKIVEQITTTLTAREAAKLITLLQNVRQQGIAPTLLAKQISAGLRELILQNNNQQLQLLVLLEKLIDVQQSADPYAKLEIILLEYIFTDSDSAPAPQGNSSISTPTPKTPVPASTPPATPPEATKKAAPFPTPPKTVQKPAETETQPNTPRNSDTRPFSKDSWPEVMAIIKQKYNTLYGTLRMAQPEFTDEEIILHFAFAFHQKRLSDPKNRKIISDAIAQISGAAPRITCVITEKPSKNANANTVTNKENTEISTISNIFGGAELLES